MSVWDAIVVGAGPAGTMAARELARLQRRVLLLEKTTFPRYKVCGCCLNQSAISSLQLVGLSALTTDCHSVPLHHVLLANSGRKVSIALPAGVAISRERFDSVLAQSAQDAGVVVHWNATAKWQSQTADGWIVQVGSDIHEGRVVIAADGLNGTFLQGLRAKPTIRANSRMGAGVILEDFPNFYHSGVIFMAVGRDGYVGLVQLEDGRLDVAAAFDVNAVSQGGNLGQLANAVLSEAGFPTLPEDAAWRGTPMLTRRPQQIAGHRWFAIGDAAGYVEPFTGEGMAWALASGLAVANIAAQTWQPHHAEQWSKAYHRIIRPRQQLCRLLTSVLRSPALCQALIQFLRYAPWLTRPLVTALNRPAFPRGISR